MRYGRRYGRRRRSAWKRRNRRAIGERIGSSSCKQTPTFEISGNIASRVLQSNEITDIAKGLDNELDKRQRNIINCRGFMIHLEYNNLNATVSQYFNFAIIAPKGSNDISTTNFFREWGSATQRGLQFSDALNSLQFHQLPINGDKYTVLKHKRMLLAHSGATTTSPVKHFGFNKIWVPVKRQLRYQSETNATCENPIYIVYWCDQFDTAAGTPSATNQMTVNIDCYMFWRETLR